MKRIYMLLAFCALLIGCNVNEPVCVEHCIFNALMETFDDDTRTSLTTGLDVAWTEGDQLTIFRGSYLGDKYQIMTEYAGKPYGDFELIEENSTDDNFSSGTELPANVAIYPYNENLAIAKNVEGDNYSYTISGVEFPAQQNYVKNSFAEESFIMTAVTESLSDHKLKFKNVGGAIRLQLKGTGTIKTISIKGNNNEDLAGTADVTVSTDATPTFEFTAPTKVVTLDCGENGVELNPAEVINFIISLPVVDFTNGFAITLKDINGLTREISTDNTNMIRRSSVLKMPEKAISFEETTISVSPSLIEFDAEGGNKTVTVTTTNTDTYYVVNEELDWLTTSISGNTVTLTASSNDSTESRNGTVIISCTGPDNVEKQAWVTVTQDGKVVTEDPLPMYYGYISKDLRQKYNLTNSIGYSGVTEECILEAVDLGTITKVDEATTMGKTSFGVVPKYSMLLIAVPSGEYVVTMDNGIGGKVNFSVSPYSNGEYTVTIDGIAYSLYGDYVPIDYTDNAYFYID